MIPELEPLEGKYEILRKLREGGMGAIYLVRHRQLGELRVVKVLRPQLQGQREFRDRFAREARVAIQLRHPHIAQLHDFALDDLGAGYIVLEFVAGRSIQDLLDRDEPLSIPLVLEIAAQALDAIGFLHRRGFVHRDIAPDNLMLSRGPDGEPEVKLIDLGIVKILRGEDGRTGTQVFLGKVRYASPEQFESSRIDGRSDLYSFGVLLYEMSTGQHPFPGSGMHSMVSGHMMKPPRPFEESDPEGRVPEELRRIVLRALAKDPADRPQTAEELAGLLRGVEMESPPLSTLIETLELDAAATVVEGAEEGSDADSAQRALDDRFRRDRRTPEPESIAETGPLAPEARSEGTTAADDLLAKKLDEWHGLLDEPLPASGWLALRRRWIWAAGAVLVGGTIVAAVLLARRPAPGSGPGEATPPAEAAPVATETAEPPASVPGIAAAAPAAPAVSEPRSEAPVPTTGWLRVDSAPWGEIASVLGPEGDPVPLPAFSSTPLRIEVPAGSYRVRIRDPRTGRARETVVAVAAGSSGSAFVALAPVDVADYFRSQGLEP